MKPWHEVDSGVVAAQLGTDPERGLTSSEAARRLAVDGPNELVESGARSAWTIAWEQLTATMVVILIVAAVVSVAVGDYKDAVAILAIVVLNAVLGFYQEFRAEKAIAALKKLAVPHVKVRRDGHVLEISARDLVGGDVMLLEAGNIVAADGRVVGAANLRTQEAALTGESQPVEKHPAAISAPDDGSAVVVGDRRNMVFMGTAVTYGRGHAVVTDTGMRTELGAIATMLQAVHREPTPLQRRLDQLGGRLAITALAIVAVMFVMGLARGEALKVMFLTAVSMAVAAVPEGLPAVVTIALALGAQRMLRRHALIRKLAAVETLGSVTVICSDKTGTLTENRMRAAILDVAGRRVELADGMTLRLDAWTRADTPHAAATDERTDTDVGLALLLAGGALCNDAVVEGEETDASTQGTAVGDPTETALVYAAAQAGFKKAHLERHFPRTAEVPFESERKRMTTIHRWPVDSIPLADVLRLARSVDDDSRLRHVAFTKGGVDQLVGISRHVWVGQARERLDEEWTSRIVRANDRLASDGMRVLGVGFRLLDGLPDDRTHQNIEKDLTFVGLVGILDPPRPEARDAVATCVAAGIRPVMITGDHPLTAGYIARALGIAAGDRILTGAELERMPPAEVADAVGDVRVFARVSPEHKLKIVEALRQRGDIVAMTGDGVNDAPALKRAHIGVAMGITGSDVSKEAADMVLLDDNFATIVAAVEEGRVIYDNIRKFVKYLLTTNSGELWLMFVAPFLGMPLPLLPLQILWINLVTDGPTALTLGVEPAERGVMQRPPYPPNESIFARALGSHVIWVGIIMAALTLGVGYWYWLAGDERWRTMVFTTLAFSQMAHVMAIRSSTDSLFTVGVLSNRWLAAAVAGTVLLQLVVVYVPLFNRLFDTLPLSGGDLILATLLASVIFAVVEIEKVVRRPGEGTARTA
ncbi:MAG: cation-translocating P-type ATPase [Vicinamibacterales bacterium]